MQTTVKGIATAVVATLIATITIQAQSWTNVTSLATPRGALTATLLDNGKVLITGGSQPGVTDHLANCELFDPATLTVMPAPSMAHARTHHQAVKLTNGQVLVVGGWGPGGIGSGSYLLSCELYDPLSNTWSAAGTMKTAAADHRLALLDDGRVLRVCGPTMDGFGTTTCELYDPVTDTWAYTGSTAVGGHSRACAKLADGRVLTAGGYMFNNDVEVYNPLSGAWAVVGTLQHWVSENRAVQLDNGKVFIMGGIYWSGIHYYYPSVDVYDPATGSVSPGPNMATPRANFEPVKLPEGDLLVIGGTTGDGVNATTTACERYRAAAGLWEPAPALNQSRAYFEAVQTQGKIFVFGGFSNQPGATEGVSTVEMLPVAPATPCEQTAQLAEQIGAAGLDGNTRPLMASLEAACAAFERGNTIAAVNQLKAFQHKVLVQVARERPEQALEWVLAAQRTIETGIGEVMPLAATAMPPAPPTGLRVISSDK